MAASVIVDVGKASAKLAQAKQVLTGSTSMWQEIAQALEAETERNFEAQGRPSWVPLSAATVAARQKRNNGGSLLGILQDRGILAASVSPSLSFGQDFAQIGAGGAAKAYAAIHQLGGTIDVPARPTTTRLRTDRQGNLLRQADGRGAVFAKGSHKQVREVPSQVPAHKINIPARPYLPFQGNAQTGNLQPEAEKTVLSIVERHLLAAFD